MPASPEGGAEAIERRAWDLLAQLSSAEKLALLEGDTDFWPGMVDIASRDASHVHPWPAGAVPRLGLTGLQFVDGPRGVVLKGGATTFPPPIARGACWDVDLEERIGAAMAREARAFGANWLAAVCVNLLRHPGWGRAQETYGEDPVRLGALGAAMTRGIQRHAVACVKHFALNSIDSSRFLVDVQVSERVLHELYLPHFRDCVEAGAGSVMSAYNQVNGMWCGQHPQLLTAILKRRWGFRGFVVTDFIFGVRDGLAALLAGQDLEMPFRMIFAGCLEAALADGQLPLDRLDDAVLRLLRVQLAVPPGTYPASLRGCAEHRALALEAATKAMVLLKNDPALLPLDPGRSLAVIGPLAAVANLGDRGSSDTRPEPGVVVTPLQGLQAAAAPGSVRHASGEGLQEAVALAADCDAALLVLGLDWRLEGEHIHPGDIAPILRQMPPPHPLLQRWWPPVARAIAAITSYGSARQGGDFAAGDRTDLALPAEQVALIQAVVAANPRTVVVLMGGGAILMEAWRQAVPAILLLWYPGERGGQALADVVFGRVSPSGRLPFAIPTHADHWPAFEPRARQVRYDLWHGYRRLQRDGHPAAFPFGFGLSYATFQLRDAVAKLADGGPLQVAVLVSNTGALASEVVVQVYVEPPGLALERPRRTLVGFGRLALEPGGSQRLCLPIPLRRLAYFDEATSHFWLEAGPHRLHVAQHSEDEGLVVELFCAATDLGP
ncbi:beta-glucosidase family protein [Cyanobium sp. Aljojuca 7D2]|uniref:beta-glucosidase family protein n=1 Tax=Cyanobium sp. Aljojuca 7D2 TaxID=2823698 RepID=UPI0020CC467A|nr:glycoside hydrolase family 3 C-terminal domain-containing protein [Cyanobium sp. Aljojuca 7D2]